jgi:hypothetical protein
LYAFREKALGRFMLSEDVLPKRSVTLISNVEFAAAAFTLKMWLPTVDARKLEVGFELALYLLAS